MFLPDFKLLFPPFLLFFTFNSTEEKLCNKKRVGDRREEKLKEKEERKNEDHPTSSGRGERNIWIRNTLSEFSYMLTFQSM